MNTPQTIPDILRELTAAGKPVKTRTLYRYFDALGIKPMATRTSPRLYPAGTSTKVMKYLGLNGKTNGDGILSLAEIKRRAGLGKGYLPLTRKEAARVELRVMKGGIK